MPAAIRIPEPGDLDRVLAIRAQAFAIPASDLERSRGRVRLDRYLGAYVDGEIAGVLAVHPLRQVFGGRPVPMGGVASVAVVPEHRGKGIAPRLLQRALETMRERGEVISSLHPATTRVYRAAGWELGGTFAVHTVPARSLGLLPPGEPERVRRATAADLPLVRERYARETLRHDGWIDRPDWFWAPEFELRDDQWYLYVCDAPSGDALDGYALYQQVRLAGRWGYGITVHELVAGDPSSTSSLWRTVASSAAQVESVTVAGADIDFLLLALPEQDIRPRGALHWMTRVVDAPGAIAARGFPCGLGLEVHLELRDKQAPWNEGKYVLRVDAGHGTLEPGGTGDVRVTANGLAGLYTGFTSARALAAAGLVHAADDAPGALDALDAAFSGPRPSMLEAF